MTVGGAAVLLAVAMAGCAPSPPPPTVVELTLRATPDVNPTASGGGAPLAVRVYQLAGTGSFTSAEFFPLYNDDVGTLKKDLVQRDDLLLAPGQSKTETITLMDPAKAIGVLAAYRDIQHATWRAVAEAPAHQTTKVTVTAGRDGVAAAPPGPGS